MIPSRMASSRFPGKPMVKINGKPMIQRVWQQAINCNIGDVVVACSENEVFDLITNLGGKEQGCSLFLVGLILQILVNFNVVLSKKVGLLI